MCLLGMAIFTSCSIASGFVKAMEPLFVCRGLSGLGSAMASTAGYRECRCGILMLGPSLTVVLGAPDSYHC
jgi:hypothetical protein